MWQAKSDSSTGATGQADRSTVVLDYADGQVYNLMPELQTHDKTIFLWAQQSQRTWIEADGTETAVPDPDYSLPIVAAQNGSQLAIKMTPQNGSWLSHSVIATILPNSQLKTAISLDAYAGTAVTLLFEIWGRNVAEGTTGYWANPRLVVDAHG